MVAGGGEAGSTQTRCNHDHRALNARGQAAVSSWPRACVAIETGGILTKGSCRRFPLGNNVPGVRKLLRQSDTGSHRKGISSPESTRLEDRRIACPNCDTGGKLNSFQR